MSVTPETQFLFDTLMERGREIGATMAELLVTGNPPPWEEDWFASAHQNAIDAAGAALREAHPEYPAVLVANYQAQVTEGFAARLVEMTAGGLPQRGRA